MNLFALFRAWLSFAGLLGLYAEEEGSADPMGDLADAMVDNDPEEEPEASAEEEEPEEGEEPEEESEEEIPDPVGKYKVIVKDASGATVEQKVSFDELKQGYTRAQEVIATRQEAERAVSHAREQATQEITQYRERADKTIAELEALVNQALGIVSPEQLMSLAQSDPDAYNAAFQRQQLFMTVRDRVRAARDNEAKQAQEQQQREVHQRMAAMREHSLKELAKAGITTAQVQKIYDEAGPMFGFSPQELASNVDYRIVLLLKNAAGYRRLSEKKPEVANKVREAPRLTPSKTTPARVMSKSEKRLQNGGARLSDLAEFFAKQ